MSSSLPVVFITGANGFVGSRLCRAFLKRNFKVIAGVRQSSNLNMLKELDVEYRYGDITKPDTLRNMVFGADYIIHNAGVVKVRRNETFFEVNEKGTRSLFEAVAANCPNIKKVIYISSAAAAGPSNDDQPITEDNLPHPISIYGESKLAGEKVALSFSDKMHVIAIRPPGIYGPGDREIFTFFDIVNKGFRPLIGNVNHKIQLVHVDDLCQGILMATTGETTSGEAYFIAEKRAYSMKELVEILADAIGKKTIPIRLPSVVFKLIAFIAEFAFKIVGATPMLTRDKARELQTSWVISTEKAQRTFDYESEIPFAKGARETYEWYRKEGWLK